MIDRLIDRMLRAAQLQVDLYHEIAADPGARLQALASVAVVAAAAGIGGGLRVAQGDFWVGVIGLLLGVLGYAAGWALFTTVAYYLSTRLLALAPELPTTRERILTYTGFAQAPAVASFFAFFPLVGLPLQLLIFGWVGVAAAQALAEAFHAGSSTAAKVAAPAVLAHLLAYFALLQLSVPITRLVT
ncbi:MAG TPA: hypothetical protein VIO14_04645 [Dehalococcoidia bacterium]